MRIEYQNDIVKYFIEHQVSELCAAGVLDTKYSIDWKSYFVEHDITFDVDQFLFGKEVVDVSFLSFVASVQEAKEMMEKIVKSSDLLNGLSYSIEEIEKEEFYRVNVEFKNQKFEFVTSPESTNWARVILIPKLNKFIEKSGLVFWHHRDPGTQSYQISLVDKRVPKAYMKLKLPYYRHQGTGSFKDFFATKYGIQFPE